MLFLARRAVPQRLLFVLFASKNGVCTLPLLLLPVVGLLSMAATGMAMWLSGVTQGWWLPPLLGGAVGAVSFAMIYRQLGVYIQDRVRIIYKTIRRLKGSGNQTQLDMAEDIVEQVNRDVMAWADLQIEEITHLRETDTFRQEFIGNLAHELKTCQLYLDIERARFGDRLKTDINVTPEAGRGLVPSMLLQPVIEVGCVR